MDTATSSTPPGSQASGCDPSWSSRIDVHVLPTPGSVAAKSKVAQQSLGFDGLEDFQLCDNINIDDFD